MIIDDIERHIKEDNLDELKEIFEKTSVNVSLTNNRSPLIHSVICHNYGITNYFLKQEKTNINHQDDDNMSALMYSAQKGFVSILKLLVYHNANPHLKNKENETAMDLAIKNRNSLCQEMLDIPNKAADKAKEHKDNDKAAGEKNDKIKPSRPLLLLTYKPDNEGVFQLSLQPPPEKNESQLRKIYNIIKNFGGN